MVYAAASAKHRKLEEWLRRDRPLDRNAELVARLVGWPRAVTWRVEECNRLAFWSANTATLTICYGYFDFLSREVPAKDFAGVLDFTLLHEVGHSLVSELSLPIVGSEEKAADLFAATVLLANRRADDVLLPSIRVFHRMSTKYKTSPWDEHPSDGQRYYDLLCLSSGAGATPREEFAGRLPEERRVRCRAEYNRGWTSWDALLRPHSRVRGGETFWPH